MNIYPVKFEADDGAGELIFTVEAFDDTCANVEIISVVTPESWAEISAAVAACLMKIGLKA